MMVPIPPSVALHCNNMVTYAGLQALGPEYEAHFASNRKVLAFSENVIFEIGNIEYYDAAEGEIPITEGVVIGARRFRWNQRFLVSDSSLDTELVDTLVNDGFNDGLPIGMIFDNANRYAELLKIGMPQQDLFCKILPYRDGEIRIYDFIDVPVYRL
jgi:hypothetical protein